MSDPVQQGTFATIIIGALSVLMKRYESGRAAHAEKWEGKVEEIMESLKDQVHDIEKMLVDDRASRSDLQKNMFTVLRALDESHQRHDKLYAAFTGYVHSAGKRIEDLEKYSSEVIELGKQIRLVRMKKAKGD